MRQHPSRPDKENGPPRRALDRGGLTRSRTHAARDVVRRWEAEIPRSLIRNLHPNLILGLKSAFPKSLSLTTLKPVSPRVHERAGAKPQNRESFIYARKTQIDARVRDTITCRCYAIN